MPGTTNIAEEITRLTDSRNTIRNKMVNFGLAEAAAKLDVLAQAVNGIANCGAVSAEVQEGDTYHPQGLPQRQRHGVRCGGRREL